jgi:hypothetical protein
MAANSCLDSFLSDTLQWLPSFSLSDDHARRAAQLFCSQPSSTPLTCPPTSTLISLRSPAAGPESASRIRSRTLARLLAVPPLLLHPPISIRPTLPEEAYPPTYRITTSALIQTPFIRLSELSILPSTPSTHFLVRRRRVCRNPPHIHFQSFARSIPHIKQT